MNEFVPDVDLSQYDPRYIRFLIRTAAEKKASQESKWPDSVETHVKNSYKTCRCDACRGRWIKIQKLMMRR